MQPQNKAQRRGHRGTMVPLPLVEFLIFFIIWINDFAS